MRKVLFKELGISSSTFYKKGLQREYPIPPKEERYNEIKKEAERLYAKGLYIKNVAKELGVSLFLLRKAGFRAGNNKHIKVNSAKRRKELLIKAEGLKRQGYSGKVIAAELYTSMQYLNKIGFKVRKKCQNTTNL